MRVHLITDVLGPDSGARLAGFTQVVGEQDRPFDDRTVLYKTLARMGWRATETQLLAQAARSRPAGHVMERP